MPDPHIIGYRAAFLPADPSDTESARLNYVPHFSSIDLARKWARTVMRKKGERVRVSVIQEVEMEVMEFEEGKMVRVEAGQ